MTTKRTGLIAAAILAAMLATPASAQWGGGWHHSGDWGFAAHDAYHGHDHGWHGDEEGDDEDCYRTWNGRRWVRVCD